MCAGVFQHHVSLSVFATLLSFISGCCVSKQALAKRINQTAVTFIRHALYAAIGSVCGLQQPRQQGALRCFNRVLIQDSTNVALSERLADFFPGACNQYRHKKATMKIQAVYDVLGEHFVHFGLSGFTRTDQASAPEILKIARKADLVLRDLGYFVLSVFKQMNQRGIFFLSRLRNEVALYHPDTGQRIELPAALRKSPVHDINDVAGVKERVAVRLVAVPVPEAVANQRRRKAKSNRDRRCHPSKQCLMLMGWQIFITNVDRSVWDTTTATTLYGIRWRIEIIFKAWKSHFHLCCIPHGSKAQLEACVLARLLYITLFQIFFDHINHYMITTYNRPLSILKVAGLLTTFPSLALSTLVGNNKALMADILKTHCSYEKRKLRLNFAEILCALS